eukprot:14895452-Alexandrium_andersonii.AAC.1
MYTGPAPQDTPPGAQAIPPGPVQPEQAERLGNGASGAQGASGLHPQGRGRGRGCPSGSRGNAVNACGLPAPGAGVALPPDIPGLYFKGQTRTERDSDTGLYKAPRRNADPA